MGLLELGFLMYSIFKFLLEKAKECGVHIPRDYKKKPTQYCGMDIKDNPYYDK